MIYNLVCVPDKRLSQVSRPVKDNEFGEPLAEHLANMATTMYAYGGVGLSGVQIGDMRQLVVIENGMIAGQDWLGMVNPRIVEIIDEETISISEGCLSVPLFNLEVPRPKGIRVAFRTPMGEEMEQDFDGIQAIIAAHEMDHADGITLFSRAGRMAKRNYKKKTKNFIYRRLGEDYGG